MTIKGEDYGNSLAASRLAATHSCILTEFSADSYSRFRTQTGLDEGHSLREHYFKQDKNPFLIQNSQTKRFAA
jgi:hypothetical protein